MGAHGIKIEYRHKHKLIELIIIDTYLTNNNNNNNNNNDNNNNNNVFFFNLKTLFIDLKKNRLFTDSRI